MLLVRPDHEDHADHLPSAAHGAAGRRARRDRRGAPRHLAERLKEHVDGLDGVLHSIGILAPGRLRVPDRYVGRRRGCPCARPALLAQGARRGDAAVDGERRQPRRAHLRREVRVAGLRLDGRRQSGVRVDEPLPRPATSVKGVERTRLRRAAALPRQSPSPGSSGSRVWERAPLGWDITDPVPAWPRRAPCCCPTGSPAATGEIIHVDGGVHVIGR